MAKKIGIDEIFAVWSIDDAMDLSQIEEAVECNAPFTLEVADGDEFDVPHRDYIFLPPKTSPKRTYVVIHHDRGVASLLPLPTITSLRWNSDREIGHS